jgi:hypothetical protein
LPNVEEQEETIKPGPSADHTTERPKEARPAIVSNPKIDNTVVEAMSAIPVSRNEGKKPTSGGKDQQKTAQTAVKDDKTVNARRATGSVAVGEHRDTTAGPERRPLKSMNQKIQLYASLLSHWLSQILLARRLAFGLYKPLTNCQASRLGRIMWY